MKIKIKEIIDEHGASLTINDIEYLELADNPKYANSFLLYLTFDKLVKDIEKQYSENQLALDIISSTYSYSDYVCLECLFATLVRYHKDTVSYPVKYDTFSNRILSLEVGN